MNRHASCNDSYRLRGGFFDGLLSAKQESLKAFGNDIALVEKYITAPRHVEVHLKYSRTNWAEWLVSLHLFDAYTDLREPSLTSFSRKFSD